MLQNIRDKTQGWITRVIFGLVCVAFILWGAHGCVSLMGSSGNEPAKVNGKEITASDVNQAYERLLQERQMQLGPNFKLTDNMQARLKQLALQKLIASMALVQSAEKNALVFTPAQVGRFISTINAFQEKGHFSPQKFSQTLARMGYTENGFFNDVRDAMLINQLRVGILASSFSLPEEANQVLQLVNQERDIAFTVIPTQVDANKIVVNEEEIKSFYQKHQNQFTTPETVTVQYLELSLPAFRKNMVLSDEDLQKFYQENANHYAKLAHGTFNEVKTELRERLTEQKALQNFSDAIDQLNNLTYTNPQSLEPAAKALQLTIQTSAPLIVKKPADGLFSNEALKVAAFSSEVLANNNSGVINLDDQHAVVLHLLKKERSQVKPLAQVSDQILSILKKQKMQSLARNTAQEIVSKVLSGKSLTEAASAQGLKVSEQSHIGRYTSSGNNGIIFNDAFQLPRPHKQASAGMFLLPSGDFVVIQILKVNTKESDIKQIQERVMNQKIENAYAQLDYALYVNGVLTDAKITANNKFEVKQ